MRVKPSRTFLKDDNEALWIGLMARDAGTRASRLLNIRDDALAFDFDRAISMRLQRHDTETQKNGAIRIAIAANAALNGKLGELMDEDGW